MLFLIDYLFIVPPLFILEFLHRVMDIFEDSFGECTESTIKENFVIVYEVRVAAIFASFSKLKN
jgi:hypothetical protein